MTPYRYVKRKQKTAPPSISGTNSPFRTEEEKGREENVPIVSTQKTELDIESYVGRKERTINAIIEENTISSSQLRSLFVHNKKWEEIRNLNKKILDRNIYSHGKQPLIDQKTPSQKTDTMDPSPWRFPERIPNQTKTADMGSWRLIKDAMTTPTQTPASPGNNDPKKEQLSYKGGGTKSPIATDNKNNQGANTKKKKFALAPIAFLIAGLSLIGSALFPIVAWQIKYLPQAPEDTIAKPIPESAIAKGNENNSGQDVTNVDYSKASSWFPEEVKWQKPTKVKYYNLSIAKLGIKDAVVEVGGEELFKNLVHYKGTSLPGQLGNTVIFGHSSLPIFFNPKNYKSIFTTLPDLKKDDRILINFDGVAYTYKVFELKIIAPTDVSVLEQSYNNSYLTLITCVPPGTYLKRLAVRARLEGS